MIRDAAIVTGQSVSEWAREAMRRARRAQGGGDRDAKLAAVRAAVRHDFPTADIDPNKREAQRLVENAVIDGRALVTDAKVYQEVLHRYSAIGRLDAVTPAFETLNAMVDEVAEVAHDDVEAARDVLLAGHATSARDAVHLAVMRRMGCTEILTFDRAFDDAVAVHRVR